MSEYIRQLAAQIIKDPTVVDSLKEDEVIEVRKLMDPLGSIIGSKKTYVNMSIINWREKYLRRLHMTALISFLFKCASEQENPAVNEWLESMFVFDHNKHVRAATCNNIEVGDPPAEIYYNFDRYFNNNFEDLMKIVEKKYSEKPDIEFGINLYGSFNTTEEARENREKNADEFRYDVVTVESGQVTLLGPFKKNTECIEYYNKNTELLSKMYEQAEADQKLGKDIMEKRVKVGKERNILDEGPEADALRAYSSSMNGAQTMGARNIITEEERDLMRDKALEVDMFYTDDNLKMRKTTFLTRAEAPLHMIPGSEFSDKYQPVE